jgi:phage-related minor tail protein
MTTDAVDPAFAASDLQTIGASLDAIDLSAARVSRSLSSAFAGAIAQGKSFEDTLRAIGLKLSSMALEAALKPAMQGLGSALSNAFSGGFGGGAASMPVTPFAEGGVVAAPTFFGAAGGLGLMGEKGAEAIMPLARGPDGRLGLAAQSGAGTTSINVTIAAQDAESFRRSQGQIEAALARAVARGRRSL